MPTKTGIPDIIFGVLPTLVRLGANFLGVGIKGLEKTTKKSQRPKEMTYFHLHPKTNMAIAGNSPFFNGRYCTSFMAVFLLMSMFVFGHVPSLKLTFSPLKMDGWNTSLSYLGETAYFQGLRLPLVSGAT